MGTGCVWGGTAFMTPVLYHITPPLHSPLAQALTVVDKTWVDFLVRLEKHVEGRSTKDSEGA